MIDRTEIAFIDPNVSDIDTLIAGFRPQVDWVRLDQSEPAPRQIARALDGRNGLAAIHIIAHGAPGEVRFGAGTLSLDSIDEQAGDLGMIGTALGERGALMLWSCQTGQGERGAAFVEALTHASGATVAAATGLVGAAARGGEWQLDAYSNARVPLTVAGVTAYSGLMAVGVPPTAPSITSVTDDVAPVIGTLTNGASTNDSDLTVKVNLSGTGAVAGNTIQLYNGTGTPPQLGTLYILTSADITNGFANVQTGGLTNNTTYVITARVTDVLNGQSGASASFTVTEDQSAPVSPSTPTLAPASDSGTKGDKLTNVNTPTFTGTAEANSTVKLFDGATQVGTGIANASGNWSITSSALSDGTHSNINATATDAAGNVSGLSSGLQVTIDTTALPPGTPDLQAASDLGPSSTDNITKVTTPTFSGTGVEASSTVTLFDGATQIGSIKADGSGNWNITSSTLIQGTHNITATQTDLAGNVSAASSALPVTIDTTAPTVSTVTASPGTADLGAGKAVTLTFVLSEAVTVVGTPTLSLNTGNNGVATYVSGSGTNTLTFGYTVRAGDNSADLAVNSTSIGNGGSITDTAGNAVDLTGALVNPAGTLQIDTSAPSTPTDPVLASTSDSGTTGDKITNVAAPTFTGTAEAGSTVTIFSDGIAVGSGVAVGGSYNIAPISALSQGSHLMKATATDVAGNVSGLSNGISVTIDTTALPPTGLVLASTTVTQTDVAGNTSAASAVLSLIVDSTAPTVSTVTASPATADLRVGQVVTLTVGLSEAVTVVGAPTLQPNDGGAASYSGGSGTNTLTFNYTVGAGQNTADLTVTGIVLNGATISDAAGNAATLVGSVNPAGTLQIDTSAPPTPSTPDLTAASDSGSSNTDNITNVTTPTFAGTAEAGSIVTIFSDNTAVGSGVASGGAYNVATSALSQGTHTITATATDAAGNVSQLSSGLSVTIISSPTVIITGISPDTGASSTDGITTAGTVTVSGIVDLPDAGRTVTVFRDGALIGTTVSLANGVWTLPTVALAEGAHTLSAQVTDGAGNTGTSNPFSATRDTIAPSAPSSAPDLTSASDSGSSSTDNITNVVTPTFTGTAEVGSTVTIFSDGTAVGSGVAGVGGAYNVVTSTLGQGAHTIKATATDAAGNVSVLSSGLLVTIDTTALPPTALVLAPTSDSGIKGDNITNVATPTFTGTAAEAGSTVKLFDGGTQIGTAIADASGNWSITSSALSQGARDITAAQTDVAGNTSAASAVLNITLDTTAPTVSTVTASPPTADLGAGKIVTLTVGLSEAVTVSGGVPTLLLSDGGTASYSAGSGTSTLTFSYTVVAGQNTADLTVTGSALNGATILDAAGNAANLIGVVANPAGTLQIDTTPPTIAIAAIAGDNTVNLAEATTGFAIAGTTLGTENGQTATITIVNGANAVVDTYTSAITGNAWSVAVTAAQARALADGSYTVRANVADAAGNPAVQATQTLTVDETAPGAPSAPHLAPASDRGLLGDNVTNIALASFTGSAEAGSTVNLFNGSTLMGTGRADGTGAWSITATTALTPGANSLVAQDTDAASNISASSNPLAVTLDTIAPTVASLTASPGTADLTAGQVVNLTLTMSEAVNVVGTPSLTLNDGGTASYVSGTGTSALVFSYTVLAGQNTADLAVTAASLNGGTIADAAGNAANLAGAAANPAGTLQIDTAPPTIAIAAPIAGDNTVNASEATTGFTITGTTAGLEDGRTATITIVNGSNTVVDSYTAAVTGNVWSINVTAGQAQALANGSYTVQANVADAAGNPAVQATQALTVDETAPGVPSAPVLSSASDSGVPGDGVTNVALPSFTGSAEAGSTVSLFNGSTLIGAGTADAITGAWSITAATALTPGANTLVAREIDAAGNISPPSNPLTVTLDTTAPTVSLVAASPSPADLTTGQVVTLTLNLSEVVNVLTTSGTPTLTLNDGGTASYVSGSGTSAVVFNYTVVAGQNTADLAVTGSSLNGGTITDVAGNAADLTAVVTNLVGTLQIDTTAPSITIDPIAGDNSVDPAEAIAGFNITGTTNAENGQSVSVTIGDIAHPTLDTFTATVTGSAWSVQVTPAEATLLGRGAYSVTADVSDLAGNPSEATFGFEVVCYVQGTHILTPTGEKLVESLLQGDIVLTLSGDKQVARPVKWIGRRWIDLMAHPRPETVAPVRVRRGAFADGMPQRDLLLSPDHAVFVDGKLICARQLINGTTIRQEQGWTSVEYFHVELDEHAILLAEGLPAESYLNTGNRGFFANSDAPLVLHPDLTDQSDYPTRAAASCVPFVSDEGSVRPVWLRLAERAAALDQPAPKLDTTNDPELRIVANGRMLRPIVGEAGKFTFVLPRGTTDLRLVSRAGSPTDARPWLDDRRQLGVRVTRIVLRGASEFYDMPVDHPDLSKGWWAVERDGVSMARWTDGDAVLPLPAFSGAAILEVRLDGEMTYLIEADAKIESEAERKAA